MPIPPEDGRPTRRNSLFAVWSWPKWVWVIAAPLPPITYFLSVPAVVYIALSFRVFDNSPVIGDVISAIAFPANWCAEHSSTLHAVWYWEWDLLCNTFGHPFRVK